MLERKFCEARLKNLLQDYIRIDSLSDLFIRIFCADYESLSLKIMWETFDHYVDALSDAVGDETGVIRNYIYDENGEAGQHRGMGEDAAKELMDRIVELNEKEGEGDEGKD